MKRLIVIFISLFLLSGWGMPSFWRKREANNLYSKQEYSKSLDIYQDLQIDNPDKAEINYNRGNVLYRLERYDEAQDAFQKSLKSKNKNILKKAYYNLGNTLYRQDKLEEAIKSYEQALKIDSTNEDATYNIEFIKNRLQKKKEQEPQQSEEKDKKNKQKQGAGQKQGKKEDKEKSGDKKKQQQQQQEKNKEMNPSSKGEKDTADVADKDKISPEDKMKRDQAKQILDALKNDEKKLKQQIYQKEEFNKQEEKVKYDW